MDKQNPTNSDTLQALIMQEWAAISQDVAQKLIDSMPGRIVEVLEKEGSTLQILTLCIFLHVIVNKSLCHV
jgi:Na+/H+-dicarboxylate symporter